ncbi:head-tail connector protein [Xanthobacter autotrophicus]|uniref:head-tail connector protein n=1 Tax=Xanthobacter autotrophicus TaxID=280 RepID=UPI0037266403
MRITGIVAPAPIVTVAEVKAWTRIDCADDDALVSSLIVAATQWLDAPSGWIGRALGVQTLEMTFGAECWRRGYLPLWYPPIRSVVGVHYRDADGIEQDLVDASWRLSGEAVVPEVGVSWPDVECRPDAARVVYQAGYDIVPEPIRLAIMMLVAQWYANREPVNIGNITSTLPFAVEALVQPFRILRV